MTGSRSRINRSIKFALRSAFNVFKDADKVVILEDDLLVSPDIVRWVVA